MVVETGNAQTLLIFSRVYAIPVGNHLGLLPGNRYFILSSLFATALTITICVFIASFSMACRSRLC